MKAAIIIAVIAVFASVSIGAVTSGTKNVKANHAKIEKILDEAK